MDQVNLETLKRDGRLKWVPRERAWLGQPNDVVDALAHDGFAEYKREIARSGPGATGGMWQGLDARTGSVASAIWVQRPSHPDPLVFIDIDGQPVTEA
jgi:hypothetical protein